MTHSHQHGPFEQTVFMTGATGFIGHYTLRELLTRDARVITLLRPPLSNSTLRLRELMSALGVDLDEAIRCGSLQFVEGSLGIDLPDLHGESVDAIVHVGGSTRFDSDGTGEPERTNVGGTKRLLAWATRQGVRHVHAVSSAYACGRSCDLVAERFHSLCPTFHNEYERTKWQMEQACRQWADADAHRTVTIYRPSIVVGAFDSGRASKFDGLYLSARAVDVLSRMHPSGDAKRYEIAVRLKGRSFEQQNIVPVDYVGRMIAAGVGETGMRGRVFHLVNPHPPTNEQIKDAMNRHFDVAGGRWVPPELFDESSLSDAERLFHDISRPIEHYFVDTPQFARHNAAALENRVGYRWRPYDDAALSRLFAYAQSTNWGRRRPASRRPTADAPAATPDFYFTRFLVDHVPQSVVARMTALTVTVRFVIDDEPDGQWVCRFACGELVDVTRGGNGLKDDLTYHFSRDVFWMAVRGALDPQAAFLDGDVRITGNVEQALKLAMILHAFNREHPFNLNACSTPSTVARSA